MTKPTPELLEKLSLYRKRKWPCVGVWGWGLWRECECKPVWDKGKVYGCKLNLNHRQKPSLLSYSDHNGHNAPQNPCRFKTVSNASQTPDCLYVPECLRAEPLQPIQAGTLKQLQLFLPFLNAYSTVRIYGPRRYSTHDTLVSQ